MCIMGEGVYKRGTKMVYGRERVEPSGGVPSVQRCATTLSPNLQLKHIF